MDGIRRPSPSRGDKAAEWTHSSLRKRSVRSKNFIPQGLGVSRVEILAVKPVDDPLGNFLSQERSRGTHHSGGAFTLSASQALLKLAAFQLPRPSAWLLKVVQSAVVLEAGSVTIAQSRKTTVVRLETPRLFELQALQMALASTLDGSGYVQSMAIALRSLGLGQGRAFELTVEQEGRCHILSWNGLQLSVAIHDRSTPAGCRLTLTVDFPPDQRGRRLGRLFRSAGLAGEEYLEMVRGAEVLPIPIHFDGRRLDTLSAARKLPWNLGHSYISLGWPELSNDPQAPLLGLPKGLKSPSRSWLGVSDFDDGNLCYMIGDQEQTLTEAFLKIRYIYKGVYEEKPSRFVVEGVNLPSYCHWVRDGVICQTQELLGTEDHQSLHLSPGTGGRDNLSLRRHGGPLCYDIYLGADDLTTDISSLYLVRDERLKQRLRRGLELLNLQLKASEVLMSQRRAKASGSHIAMMGGVVAATTIGITLVVGPVTFLGASLASTFGVPFGAFALTASRQDKAKVLGSCLDHLRQAARQSLHYNLADSLPYTSDAFSP